MPAKISEKQLFLGLVFLLAGFVVLLNTTLVNAPVTISEKGLFVGAVGLGLLFFSVKFFLKSVHKQ